MTEYKQLELPVPTKRKKKEVTAKQELTEWERSIQRIRRKHENKKKRLEAKYKLWHPYPECKSRTVHCDKLPDLYGFHRLGFCIRKRVLCATDCRHRRDFAVKGITIPKGKSGNEEFVRILMEEMEKELDNVTSEKEWREKLNKKITELSKYNTIEELIEHRRHANK